MTTIVIKVMTFVFDFVFKILPDMSEVFETFSNANNVVGVIVDFVKQVNFIVPLPTIAKIVAIEVTIHIAIFLSWVGAKIAKTVVSLIP